MNKRPSVLFLTGDQIYADDVAGPLIQHLTEFGAHLLGWEEEIVGLNKKLTEIGPGERQQFISEHAKFTSENGGNHLISFGEFAAMYLISWNIQNWPLLFQDIEFVAEKKVKRKYQIEIEQLKRSQRALPVVRRILANIPTYMMFDDHDITDDWNITREWNERVKESDYGKQIVANGLAAFWAFQAWGNDPSLYSDEFITGITQYLDKNSNPNIHTRKSFVDYLWNFHDWTFAAPTYPVTIFIDSRTQRKYDSLKGPPILLNDEGLESISRTTYKVNYYNKGDLILIVSPTPVFGFELAEKLQKYLASKSNVYKWDLETWASNKKGFIHFLRFLITTLSPSRCIFLSGDVHYDFSVRATFELTQKTYGREKDLTATSTSLTNMIQLTSSALKTTSLSKEVIINEFLGRLSQLFSSRNTVLIGWNNNNISEKSQKIKQYKGSRIEHILNKLKHSFDFTKKQQQQQKTSQLPDWVESRSIIQPSGFSIPSLVVTDNNIGLVTIDHDKHEIYEISHSLLVLKRSNVKIHKAVL